MLHFCYTYSMAWLYDLLKSEGNYMLHLGAVNTSLVPAQKLYMDN